MRIGILGETHDHMPNIRRVVERLNGDGVELVLHTGDSIAPFVIPVLAGLDARMVGVFGNNDGDRELLILRCDEHPSLEISGNFAEFTLEDRRVALLHGHIKDMLAETIGSGRYDLVVHGHTHKSQVDERNGTIVLNPGEVCGYLSGVASYATYETASNQPRIITITD